MSAARSRLSSRPTAAARPLLCMPVREEHAVGTQPTKWPCSAGSRSSSACSQLCAVKRRSSQQRGQPLHQRPQAGRVAAHVHPPTHRTPALPRAAACASPPPPLERDGVRADRGALHHRGELGRVAACGSSTLRASLMRVGLSPRTASLGGQLPGTRSGRTALSWNGRARHCRSALPAKTLAFRPARLGAGAPRSASDGSAHLQGAPEQSTRRPLAFEWVGTGLTARRTGRGRGRAVRVAARRARR